MCLLLTIFYHNLLVSTVNLLTMTPEAQSVHSPLVVPALRNISAVHGVRFLSSPVKTVFPQLVERPSPYPPAQSILIEINFKKEKNISIFDTEEYKLKILKID